MSYQRRDLFAAATATGGAGLIGLSQLSAQARGQAPEEPLRGAIFASQGPIAADGATDDTANVQAIFDANPGRTIVFDGTMKISRTLVVSGDKTTLVFRNGAGFLYSAATMTGMAVRGHDVTVEGVTFTAPATFDGTNEQPNYAVIWVTGDNSRFVGGRLVNVPKVGIMFSDCEGGLVSQMRIRGNFPRWKFSGKQFAHAGILVDARGTGRQGNFIFQGNDIAECVQGVLIANYGPASRSEGIIISANNFYRCWNHGVYGAGTNYANSVVGNTFVGCQVPIALSGHYHVVSGNTITTGGSSGTSADEVGISLRDPVHCIVANNVLQGETAENQVVINLLALLGTSVRGNIVSGNTMQIGGGGSAVLIRLGGVACTDLTNNQVTGNACLGRGRDRSGLIQLLGDTSCSADGTIVSSNSVVAKSASHAIELINVLGASVVQNRMRFEHDAGAAVELAGIAVRDSSNCDFAGNSMTVSAAWGRNVSLIGLWEAGASSGNRAANNALRAASTKLAAAIPYKTATGSGIIIDDAGSGPPSFGAGMGSIWRRSDGAPGATLYVKESAGASGWVTK